MLPRKSTNQQNEKSNPLNNITSREEKKTRLSRKTTTDSEIFFLGTYHDTRYHKVLTFPPSFGPWKAFEDTLDLPLKQERARLRQTEWLNNPDAMEKYKEQIQFARGDHRKGPEHVLAAREKRLPGPFYLEWDRTPRWGYGRLPEYRFADSGSALI